MKKRGAYARGGDPDTSHDAAERVDVTKNEALALDCLIRNHPLAMTSMEVANETGVHPWTISPRMRPLEEKGKIERVGKKPSLNSNGKIQNLTAWKAKK